MVGVDDVPQNWKWLCRVVLGPDQSLQHSPRLVSLGCFNIWFIPLSIFLTQHSNFIIAQHLPLTYHSVYVGPVQIMPGWCQEQTLGNASLVAQECWQARKSLYPFWKLEIIWGELQSFIPLNLFAPVMGVSTWSRQGVSPVSSCRVLICDTTALIVEYTIPRQRSFVQKFSPIKHMT